MSAKLFSRSTPPVRCLGTWANYGPAVRRTFSATRAIASNSALTAPQAVEQLTTAFRDRVDVRRQILDANQLQKLSLTLGRRELDGSDISDVPPATGTPIPPGWHLVYFTPNGVESELGPDGTDRTFNSPAPFTRRMWAGGRMQWPGAARTGDKTAVLRVGDEVEERTRFIGASAKKSRAGSEMILVEIEKEYWGPSGLSLVDQRSWIFQPEITVPPAGAKKPIDADPRSPSRIADEISEGRPLRHMSWSPTGLFRFSALTFNGHKIHYNQEWTRDVEGHPGEVVHGPLNLINMLDYWRDHYGTQGAMPTSIFYRAMSPIYAGEAYSVRTADVKDTEDGHKHDIVVDKKGVVCMKGEIASDSL